MRKRLQNGLHQGCHSALVFELSKLEHLHVKQAMVGHLRHVDGGLAQRVADGLGLPLLPLLPPAPPSARPVQDLPPSAALRTIGKAKNTLASRCIGILVADGSDGTAIAALTKAAKTAGASVKLVAPKVGGVNLSNGSKLAVDGQLAGTPSVIFDAVAVLLCGPAAKALSAESAAVDFVRDAYGHLKAMAVDAGGQALLQACGVRPCAGVLAVTALAEFLAAATTRQWDRERSVRSLA